MVANKYEDQPIDSILYLDTISEVAGENLATTSQGGRAGVLPLSLVWLN
jgi:hypothetical protein